jgi:ribosome-binding ATPase
MISDLGQIEKRLERLEKDLKKMKTPELEKENELLIKAKGFLETEKPLREMEMSVEDKKRIRGFMFLSEKPMLYVLNIGESTQLGKDLEAAVGEIQSDRSVGSCERRGQRHLRQSRSRTGGDDRRRRGGISRQLRTVDSGLAPHPQELSPAGPDFILHCRRGRMPCLDHSAQYARPDGAGAIHSDLEKHFIRAETIRWDQLLEAGSEANARAKGTLRLEGKDYIVQDGDVMHIRHSG